MASPFPSEEQASISGADTDSESSSAIHEKGVGDGDSEDKFNRIRLTKADLKKFPNFSSTKISSLKDTEDFIVKFIEGERDKKTPKKQKLIDEHETNENTQRKRIDEYFTLETNRNTQKKRKHNEELVIEQESNETKKQKDNDEIVRRVENTESNTSKNQSDNGEITRGEESRNKNISFIQTENGEIDRSEENRNRTNQKKRKLNDEFEENVFKLKMLPIKHEIDECFNTDSEDDFKLMVFHSKVRSVCDLQRFTKSLVEDFAGEEIVSEKYSSSLLYFFYRFLDSNKMPEIFIMTVGQTWRLADKVGCSDFLSKFKDQDLEKDPVQIKYLHADMDNVLTTEYNARQGRHLCLSDEEDLIEKKSTRYLKPESKLHDYSAFKKRSRIFLKDSSFSLPLSLNIKEIHNFIKTISSMMQKNELEMTKGQNKLDTELDTALIEELDKQLLKRLKEKEGTKMYLQHDTDEWNKIDEVHIHLPNSKVTFDLPVSVGDIIPILRKERIPESDWLQKITVKWTEKAKPLSLKYFLEDYIIMDNLLYRYLFGKWRLFECESIARVDQQFRRFLKTSFLKASEDFPILPWLHTLSDGRDTGTVPDKKSPKELMDSDYEIPTNKYDIIELGQLYSNTTQSSKTDGKSPQSSKRFQTENLTIKSIKETLPVHKHVNIDLRQIIPGTGPVEDNSSLKFGYSIPVNKKISNRSYTVPDEGECSENELEKLLFLRLSTKLSEGEYNDCHMLLRRILEKRKENRFVIIPGDELFVVHKNTELYDILISDEKNKITYVVHVKADLGNKTRDACSQLRISAEKIKQSLVVKSSKPPLAKYWETNAYGSKMLLPKGYKGDVGLILSEMGKTKFIELFSDETRRLIFVYACRDSRTKTDLKKEAEYVSSLNLDQDEESQLRKRLLEKDIPSAQIKDIVDKLKEKKILDSNGCITNSFKYQTKKGEILEEIAKAAPKGKQLKVEEVLKEILNSHVSESDIAKSELIRLEKQFQKFRVGRKKFELKICQIPTEFYLA